MEFIAIYRDPKKKNLQRLEILFVLLALPIALVWGARSYKEWSAFSEAERLFVEGDTYLHSGRSDLAIENFKRSVELYPSFYGAWEALAASYHLKNDHQAELKAYQDAVAVLPQMGELHRELGTAYHEVGDHKLELEHLSKASEILGKEEIFTFRLLDRAQREMAGTYPTKNSNHLAAPAAGAKEPELDANLGHGDHEEGKPVDQGHDHGAGEGHSH